VASGRTAFHAQDILKRRSRRLKSWFEGTTRRANQHGGNDNLHGVRPAPGRFGTTCPEGTRNALTGRGRPYPESMSHLVLRLLLAAAVFAAALAAWWWTHPPDPIATLRACWAPPVRVERLHAPELGTGIERWRIFDARGDSVSALWRPAPTGASEPWTVVLLGGFHTGDRAALVLPEDEPANVLAVDWPWSEERSLSSWEIMAHLRKIQAAALRSPAALALGVEAARSQPDVDSTRLAVFGVSLGVPPALAALRLTRAPRALALIDGAAGLQDLFDAELRTAVRPRALAAPIAALAYRLVRPLEPALNADAAAGLPVLMINAADDELMPHAGVQRLRAGIPQATYETRPGKHIRPSARAEIAALTARAASWLNGLRPVASHP